MKKIITSFFISTTVLLAQPTLKEAYKEYFPVGAALSYINYKYYPDEIYEHFNSGVHENALKWESVQEEEGKFNFKRARSIVDFAKSKGVDKFRGHALLWHYQVPDWVFVDDNGNKASLEKVKERLTTHIETVMTEFKGDIYAWDVVNEAISDKPGEQYRNKNDVKRDASGWRQAVKSDQEFEELLAHAFKVAKKVDPNAVLFYNDYSLTVPSKREKTIKMVKRLKELGAPIDGVGEQGHFTIPEFNKEELEKSIKMFTDLGVQFQITELDVSFYAFNDQNRTYKEPTKEMLNKQAQVYKDIFELGRKYKGKVTGITMWGMADDHTWLKDFPVFGRKNWPLLFDEEYKPKVALEEIIEFKN